MTADSRSQPSALLTPRMRLRQDTLNFCALTGIRPMVETLPLEEAAIGYERMLSGKARFRVVLTMN